VAYGITAACMKVLNNMTFRIVDLLMRRQDSNSRTWIHKLLKKCFIGDMNQLCISLGTLSLEKPVSVLTLNLNHLRISTQNQGFKKTYLLGDYILADGMPIRWIANRLMNTQVNRLSGVDLVFNLIQSEASLSVVGSSRETVRNALEKIGKDNFQIPVFEGQISNDASDEEIRGVLEFIDLSKKRFVLLALTTEKQLALIQKISESSAATPAIYVSVGGSFDMISGKYLRAPKTIQNAGLEWFWRAIQNPKILIPRYSKDFLFLFGFFFSSQWLGKEEKHEELP